MDMSTSFSQPILDTLNQEVHQLQDELDQVKYQRDEALKDNLILKQINQFYKNKNEIEDKALQQKVFTLEQSIQKKDNMINHMQTQLDELTKQNTLNGIKVIERFILEPTEWNMKFQNETKKIEKSNLLLQRQVTQLNLELQKNKIVMQNLKSEAKSQQQVAEIYKKNVLMLQKEVAQVSQDKSQADKRLRELQDITNNQVVKIMNNLEIEKQTKNQKIQQIENQINVQSVMNPSIKIISMGNNKYDDYNDTSELINKIKNPDNNPKRQDKSQSLDMALSSIGSNIQINSQNEEVIPHQSPADDQPDNMFQMLNSEQQKQNLLGTISSYNHNETDLMESAKNFSIDRDLENISKSHFKFKGSVPQLNFTNIPNYQPLPQELIKQQEQIEKEKIEQPIQAQSQIVLSNNDQPSTQQINIEEVKVQTQQQVIDSNQLVNQIVTAGKRLSIQKLNQQLEQNQQTSQSISDSKLSHQQLHTQQNVTQLSDKPIDQNTSVVHAFGQLDGPTDSEDIDKSSGSSGRRQNKLDEILALKVGGNSTVQTEPNQNQYNLGTVQSVKNETGPIQINQPFEIHSEQMFEEQSVGQGDQQMQESSKSSQNQEGPKVVTINGKTYVVIGDSDSEPSIRQEQQEVLQQTQNKIKKIDSPVEIISKPIAQINKFPFNMQEIQQQQQLIEVYEEDEEEEIDSDQEQQQQQQLIQMQQQQQQQLQMSFIQSQISKQQSQQQPKIIYTTKVITDDNNEEIIIEEEEEEGSDQDDNIQPNAYYNNQNYKTVQLQQQQPIQIINYQNQSYSQSQKPIHAMSQQQQLTYQNQQIKQKQEEIMETEVVIEEEEEEEIDDDNFRYDESNLNKTQLPPQQNANLNKSFIEQQQQQKSQQVTSQQQQFTVQQVSYANNQSVAASQVKPLTQKYQTNNPFMNQQANNYEEEEVEVIVEEEEEEELSDNEPDVVPFNQHTNQQSSAPTFKVKNAFSSKRNSQLNPSILIQQQQQQIQQTQVQAFKSETIPSFQTKQIEVQDIETPKVSQLLLPKTRNTFIQPSQQIIKPTITTQIIQQQDGQEVIVEEEEEEETERINQQSIRNLQQSVKVQGLFVTADSQQNNPSVNLSNTQKSILITNQQQVQESNQTEVVIEEEEEEEIDEDNIYEGNNNQISNNNQQTIHKSPIQAIKQGFINQETNNQQQQQETEVVIEEEEEEELDSDQEEVQQMQQQTIKSTQSNQQQINQGIKQQSQVINNQPRIQQIKDVVQQPINIQAKVGNLNMQQLNQQNETENQTEVVIEEEEEEELESLNDYNPTAQQNNRSPVKQQLESQVHIIQDKHIKQVNSMNMSMVGNNQQSPAEEDIEYIIEETEEEEQDDDK
eukprot:403335121